ncbi:MAG: tRNA (guanosine(46)-N7)-methyltransferase TrmB [Verrucomicrobia bacterium]|nr:tRNA (guanosine(46)-N7)-methyltransferase TrmB [Verrucomicrobiota bacterium]
MTAPPVVPESWILCPDIMQRLDFPALFGNEYPVELELGAGDGSFLAQWAAAVPDHNFVGVERLLGRLRKLDRKARRAGLRNLRCLRVEGSYVLEWMVPQGSLAGLHVYFPDPWPKRRHWKRRLIQRRFAELAAAALVSGGHVFLRTDHEGYFEAIQEAFAGMPEFRAVPVPQSLLAVTTDFERDFNAQGIPTRHATYERR